MSNIAAGSAEGLPSNTTAGSLINEQNSRRNGRRSVGGKIKKEKKYKFWNHPQYEEFKRKFAEYEMQKLFEDLELDSRNVPMDTDLTVNSIE